MLTDYLVGNYSEFVPRKLEEDSTFCLEMMFPHLRHALVASYGVIFRDEETVTDKKTLEKKTEECISTALILNPCDFGPYIENHPWAFPAKEQIEMAAQAAGLRFAVEMVLTRGKEELKKFKLPFTRQTGLWKRGPLPVTREETNYEFPIVATVREFELTPIPRMSAYKYTAAVEFCTSKIGADGSPVQINALLHDIEVMVMSKP